MSELTPEDREALRALSWPGPHSICRDCERGNHHYCVTDHDGDSRCCCPTNPAPTTDAEARLAAVREACASPYAYCGPQRKPFVLVETVLAALDPAPTTCPVATEPGHPCHVDATACPHRPACLALMGGDHAEG